MKFKMGEKIKYIVSYNLWEDKLKYNKEYKRFVFAY